jgi:hypothetical protein
MSLLISSIRVEAEEFVSSVPFHGFEFENVNVKYFYTDNFYYYWGLNTFKVEDKCDVTVSSKVFIYHGITNGSTYISFYSYEPFEVNFKNPYDNYNSTVRSSEYNGIYFVRKLTNCFNSSLGGSFNSSGTAFENRLHTAFLNYMLSDEFVIPELAVEVDWYNARSNANYALKNVKGSAIDNVFTATWGLPDLLPVDAKNYPILVDFTITDLETGEKSVYSYPAMPDVYGASRHTHYDLYDLSLSVDLTKIKELPTDFRVDFVTLTPYYIVTGEYLDLSVCYKGQSSTIYLGYSGHYEFVVQTPPDSPVVDVTEPEETEKGIFVSIQNFFSGFFSNFGNMLKDLFIPSKQQMQFLFSDIEVFFSERLGFLWFPFDLAITIVETFTYGEAATTFKVPAIDINILGGVHLYDGGEFPIDQVGILPTVKVFTSIMLACGVAALAYRKWDEWIGGHDN